MKKPFRIILCILCGIVFFAFTLVLFAAYLSITDGASFTEVLTSEDTLFFASFFGIFMVFKLWKMSEDDSEAKK